MHDNSLDYLIWTASRKIVEASLHVDTNVQHDVMTQIQTPVYNATWSSIGRIVNRVIWELPDVVIEIEISS